jgi:hypothetical protein
MSISVHSLFADVWSRPLSIGINRSRYRVLFAGSSWKIYRMSFSKRDLSGR